MKSELGEEEAALKKTERSMEVLSLQLKALEERQGELEREGREAGSTIDTAHLSKLESKVKAFEKDHTKAVEKAGRVESEVKRYERS